MIVKLVIATELILLSPNIFCQTFGHVVKQLVALKEYLEIPGVDSMGMCIGCP